METRTSKRFPQKIVIKTEVDADEITFAQAEASIKALVDEANIPKTVTETQIKNEPMDDGYQDQISSENITLNNGLNEREESFTEFEILSEFPGGDVDEEYLEDAEEDVHDATIDKMFDAANSGNSEYFSGLLFANQYNKKELARQKKRAVKGETHTKNSPRKVKSQKKKSPQKVERQKKKSPQKVEAQKNESPEKMETSTKNSPQKRKAGTRSQNGRKKIRQMLEERNPEPQDSGDNDKTIIRPIVSVGRRGRKGQPAAGIVLEKPSVPQVSMIDYSVLTGALTQCLQEHLVGPDKDVKIVVFANNKPVKSFSLTNNIGDIRKPTINTTDSSTDLTSPSQVKTEVQSGKVSDTGPPRKLTRKFPTFLRIKDGALADVEKKKYDDEVNDEPEEDKEENRLMINLEDTESGTIQPQVNTSQHLPQQQVDKTWQQSDNKVLKKAAQTVYDNNEKLINIAKATSGVTEKKKCADKSKILIPNFTHSGEPVNEKDVLGNSQVSDKVKQILDKSQVLNAEKIQLVEDKIVEIKQIKTEDKLFDPTLIPNYRCQFCNRAYAYNRSLLQHVTSEHRSQVQGLLAIEKLNHQTQKNELEKQKIKIVEKIIQGVKKQVESERLIHPGPTTSVNISNHNTPQNSCSLVHDKHKQSSSLIPNKRNQGSSVIPDKYNQGSSLIPDKHNQDSNIIPDKHNQDSNVIPDIRNQDTDMTADRGINLKDGTLGNLVNLFVDQETMNIMSKQNGIVLTKDQVEILTRSKKLESAINSTHEHDSKTPINSGEVQNFAISLVKEELQEELDFDIKNQSIESKDQSIESKNQSFESKNQSIESKNQAIKYGSVPSDDLSHVFVCEQCGKYYKALRGLKEHFLREHTNTQKESTQEPEHISTKQKSPEPSMKQNVSSSDQMSNIPYVLPESQHVDLSVVKDEPIEKYTHSEDENSKDKVNQMHKLFTQGPLSEIIHSKNTSQQTKVNTLRSMIKQVESNKTNNNNDQSIDSEGDMQPVFVCEHCGKYYRARKTLKDHFLREHAKSLGEEPLYLYIAGNKYQCTVCFNFYHSSSELIAHTKTHTGELRCKCPLCDREYSSVHVLRRHIDNCHSEVRPRPFRCQLCDYAASNKWHLKEHHRRHTGEQPFSCPICSKSFSHQGTMNRHCKTIHKFDSTTLSREQLRLQQGLTSICVPSLELTGGELSFTQLTNPEKEDLSDLEENEITLPSLAALASSSHDGIELDDESDSDDSLQNEDGEDTEMEVDTSIVKIEAVVDDS